MISRSKEDSFLTPDLTPLIDVTFLLLIFFLVSSVFKKEEQILKLILPQTLSGQKINSKNLNHHIQIESSGKILFESQILDLKSLEIKVPTLSTESSFKISADSKTSYDKVIQILDLLKKNNFHKVSLVTLKKGKKK